jgi:integrase
MPAPASKSRFLPKDGSAKFPNDREVASVKEVGDYRLAGHSGLTLSVKSVGASGSLKKTWVFRYTSPATQKQRETTWGDYPVTGVKDANEKWLKWRAHIASGICPIEQQKALKEAARVEAGLPPKPSMPKEKTFWDCVEEHIAAEREGWSTRREGKTNEDYWRTTFKKTCEPINRLPINSVGLNEVASVLRPIWGSPSTVKKIRTRIQAVISRATAMRIYTHPNPAEKSIQDRLIRPHTRKELQVQHRESLPYLHLPKFWKFLSENFDENKPQRMMLELLILYGFRWIEVQFLQWDDLVEIKEPITGKPYTCLKAKTDKSIDYLSPLLPMGLKVIERAKALGGQKYVFPSPHSRSIKEQHYSENTLTKFISEQCSAFTKDVTKFTPHGFRSTLETWANEQTTGYSAALITATIGHNVKTEYNRAEFLSKKVALLTEYHDYIAGGKRHGKK